MTNKEPASVTSETKPLYQNMDNVQGTSSHRDARPLSETLGITLTLSLPWTESASNTKRFPARATVIRICTLQLKDETNPL